MNSLHRHIVSLVPPVPEQGGRFGSMKSLLLLLLALFSMTMMAQEVDTIVVERQDTVSVALDTIGWTQTIAEPRTLYDLPYSTTRRMHDWHRLARNTTAFTLAGVATLYILETLPEDATAWNKKELRRMGLFERWRYHADRGPVWDKDGKEITI